MRLHKKKCAIFADYHQFYLWDSGKNPQAPTEYDEVDVARRIKVGPNVVVIQPERNMTVPVELEVHDSEPKFDAKKWDHIAEASLHLPTGKLQVHECTGGAVADFEVAPGWYRVRSFGAKYASLDDSRLEGEDHYKIVVWPEWQSEVRVIKQWKVGE